MHKIKIERDKLIIDDQPIEDIIVTSYTARNIDPEQDTVELTLGFIAPKSEFIISARLQD